MPTQKNAVVLSYLELRRFVGWIALGLPFALVLLGLLMGVHPVQSSISAYYYTHMRNLFVGSLCAISMFMLACRGYDRKDEFAGRLSAVFALGVAFCPTTPDWPPTPLQLYLGRAHYTFAVLLFSTLAYFCLALFVKSSDPSNMTRQKRRRNNVYRICGWVIIVSMVVIIVLKLLGVHHLVGSIAPLLTFETTSLVAFGFAWLVKGERFLHD